MSGDEDDRDLFHAQAPSSSRPLLRIEPALLSGVQEPPFFDWAEFHPEVLSQRRPLTRNPHEEMIEALSYVDFHAPIAVKGLGMLAKPIIHKQRGLPVGEMAATGNRTLLRPLPAGTDPTTVPPVMHPRALERLESDLFDTAKYTGNTNHLTVLTWTADGHWGTITLYAVDVASRGPSTPSTRGPATPSTPTRPTLGITSTTLTLPQRKNGSAANSPASAMPPMTPFGTAAGLGLATRLRPVAAMEDVPKSVLVGMRTDEAVRKVVLTHSDNRFRWKAQVTGRDGTPRYARLPRHDPHKHCANTAHHHLPHLHPLDRLSPSTQLQPPQQGQQGQQRLAPSPSPLLLPSPLAPLGSRSALSPSALSPVFLSDAEDNAPLYERRMRRRRSAVSHVDDSDSEHPAAAYRPRLKPTAATYTTNTTTGNNNNTNNSNPRSSTFPGNSSNAANKNPHSALLVVPVLASPTRLPPSPMRNRGEADADGIVATIPQFLALLHADKSIVEIASSDPVSDGPAVEMDDGARLRAVALREPPRGKRHPARDVHVVVLVPDGSRWADERVFWTDEGDGLVELRQRKFWDVIERGRTNGRK